MEQYLNDSPLDYNYDNKKNGSNEPETFGAPLNDVQYDNQFNNQFENQYDNQFNNQYDNQFNNQFNDPQSNNNFSLDIEQPYGNQYEETNYPSIPGTEFLSPKSNIDPSSLQNDPFLDEFDNFQNVVEPQQTVNLDEIISPHNNGNRPFLDSQYFSPPTRQTVNLDSLAGNNDLTFSPGGNSRHGSVSMQNNFDSYLSPQKNLFVSPGTTDFNNSYDTLKSPNFGSYLNSPPQYNHMTSTSIPNPNTNINNFLSPPTKSTMLGTSAPTNNNNIEGENKNDLPSKQLTKEEKLKRRREFHNAVERRRRDLIKERIKELGVLVPPSLLNPQLIAVQTLKNSKLNSQEVEELLASVKVKETKPNKSTILNKSVDYVVHLKYVLEEQEKTRKQLEAKLSSLQIEDKPSQTQANPNFMQDFQNHSQSQYIKEEDNFNPDEFFLEIITGSEGNV